MGRGGIPMGRGGIPMGCGGIPIGRGSATEAPGPYGAGGVGYRGTFLCRGGGVS